MSPRSGITGERVSSLGYLVHLLVDQIAGGVEADTLLLNLVASVKDDTEDPRLAKVAKLRWASTSTCVHMLLSLRCIALFSAW